MEKLNYFQAIMKEDIQKDKDRDANIAKMRDILGCIPDFPQELKDLPWFAEYVTSTPTDGIDAAVRVFATNYPSIRVFPPGIIIEELQRAEGIEDALMWGFRKANQRGVHRPLETSLTHVLSFGIAAAQVRYIPYCYKKELKKKKGETEKEYARRTRRIRAMRQQGDFTYVFHQPETVHTRCSPDMLESVSLSKVMTVADVVREVGAENSGIKKMLAKIESKDEKKQADLEKTLCVYCDLTDYDYRVRWAYISDTIDESAGGKDVFEFTREEHELDFLPWVYRECGKPLLQTVIDSHSYDRQNEIGSLYLALMKAVVAHPGYASTTPSGEGVEIDYTQPGGQIILKPGESITNVQPRQMDQTLPAQVQQGDAALGRQMNTQALTALTEFAKNTPFASLNAILQATVSSLSDKRLTAESFWEDVFYQELRWIKYSGIPLAGQRIKARRGAEGNPLLQKGSTVTLGGEGPGSYMFDPDALTIKVKLREDTPTDRQTRLNSAFMLHKEGKFAMETCLEEFGLDDIETNDSLWLEEQLEMAVVQAKTRNIIQESDMALREQIKAEVMKEIMTQMKQQQGQQQEQPQQGQEMTPQNQQNEMAMGDQNMLAQGQQGGAASAMVASNMTREMVSGQDRGGGEVAR